MRTINSRSAIYIHAVAMFAILVAGFTLRAWNLNFDQGLSTHPDERSTVCFIAPSIGWPRSIDEFFDADRSPLNPMWNRVEQRPTSYTYGHFPLYLGILSGKALHALAPIAERVGVPANAVELMARADQPCGGIAVAGRLMIAVMDTLTIWLLYLLGRRMFGVGTGIVAAAFYAFSAQAIQLAHFFAMDPASTSFTVMAVLGGVTMVQQRSLRAAVFTGIGAGLAIASKFSALPVLAVPVTAAVLWLAISYREGARRAAASQARALAALVIAFAVVGITFFLTSPYAILDWARFSQATLVDQGQMVRGVADFPFTRQYRNTLPYIYFIQQQVAWGLWWPLGILSLVGTLGAAVVLVRSLIRLAVAWLRGELESLQLSRVELANIVVWSWVAPYFGITGAFLAKFNRYMSSVLPFAVLFGAGVLWVIWQWGRTRAAQNENSLPSGLARWAPKVVSGVLGVLVLAGSIFWSLAYVNGIHGREHTWITASRWIYQNVPSGSVLLWELWDDALPKTIPNEPGMDMGTTGLRNIDWSPYEEDTAEKYAILKLKLTEADYVVYSSKRIYDSVNELPERYPMTNLYYEAMWDGRLGFELAADITSPPQLLGMEFDDRTADESWSLYDHPQVTIFRKVRQLSDAEFDAVFDRSWERAVPYYRGKDSPISPLLEFLGLGSSANSNQRGLISALVHAVTGKDDGTPTPEQRRNDLMIDEPLANLPVVDNYRWNSAASNSPVAAVIVWWAVVALLGLAAWPICFALFSPWLDRGYLFSRTIGWLLAGWLLWLLASVGVLYNTVVNSWLVALLLVAVGGYFAWRQREALRVFVKQRWGLLLFEEALFAAAFAFFVFLRMVNPDLWQPWFGGEKFMEFAFLNGILRSPTFPPVDPHFSGGYINYYYFGIYLVAYLIKLTGIYAEVAFNLTIPLLFAVTVANAFAIAHTAWGQWRRSVSTETVVWWRGVVPALVGSFLVALMGNLDGYGQIVRQLSERSQLQLQSALPGLSWLVGTVGGLLQVASGQTSLPAYDFWGPSRVIPATINEFPYWSFLFADLHPHLIGIPLSILFVGVVLALLLHYGDFWKTESVRGLALLVLLAFLLGALSSVNLWELPTYLGLGILTILVSEYRYGGRIHLGRVALATFVLLAGALLFYFPFFSNYVNVGASGIGFVRQGDELGLWLLVWGCLGFIIVSWLLWSARNGGVMPNRSLRDDALLTVPVVRATVQRDEQPVFEADTLPDAVVLVAADESEVDGIAIEPVADEVADEVANDIANDVANDVDGQTITLREEVVMASVAYSVPVEHAALADAAVDNTRNGVARLVGMSMRQFDRLPRLWYLHRLLVQEPTLAYLLGLAAIPLLLVVAIVTWLMGRGVLGLCLAVLAISLHLLWRRKRETDGMAHLASMLALTGVAILAGTQVIYLKDFLQGGDWYRMNTLFKFFNQVWVLWGVAAAIALPRLWDAASGRVRRVVSAPVPVSTVTHDDADMQGDGWQVEPEAVLMTRVSRSPWRWGLLWRFACVVLLVASSVYLVFGTPARLSQRFVGWVPPFGTLNGLAFMQEGQYRWPNDSNTIQLAYDYAAIEWLLANVRGNVVIAESSEVDYYRAGGTRVASMTGLSGLRGSHVSEQRYGDQVGARDGLHREFWSTLDVARTEELISQLQISLIYVGQLERYLHPEGVQKLANMATEGRLEVLYQNDGVLIYVVPGSLVQTAGGWYEPVSVPLPAALPSVGMRFSGEFSNKFSGKFSGYSYPI